MDRCKMRGVIYTRVSTEEQGREGVSLAHQVDKCKLQAGLGDWEVVEEIQDAGRSAKTLNRPGIQRVIDLVKSRTVQAVIIYKLDRLTRNVSDLNRLIELFMRHGVALISIKDSLDTASAAGRMVINMLGTISQWEREVIAERTSEALQFKKASARRYTRITPYGFTLAEGRYIPNPVEQETVGRIVKLRDEMGFSYQEIATMLTREGIPTRQGGPWSKQTVQKLHFTSSQKCSQVHH
jgi:site-specific DNA recombinase